MKFRVDAQKCTGHGICEEISPESFEVGDDGIARTLRNDVTGELEREVRAAAAQCPARAILVDVEFEDPTGQVEGGL